MAKGKTQTFKGRNVRGKTDDEAVKQRQADAERTLKEAEEGTGTKTEKGYAGSGDYGGGGNRNLDPGQASREQMQRQERGELINDEEQTDKPAE